MSISMALLFAVAIPLRNPCWPIGYEGLREPIVDEVQVKAPTTEVAQDEDTRTSITAEAIAEAAEMDESHQEERRWIRARKALKIGGSLKLNGEHPREAITINGFIYADGDLISFNHEGYRFTWRVKEVTKGNALRLMRVRMRNLSDEPSKFKIINTTETLKGSSK